MDWMNTIPGTHGQKYVKSLQEASAKKNKGTMDWDGMVLTSLTLIWEAPS
jgi:hypothetical protein